MKDLKALSSEALNKETELAVKQERASTSIVVKHFQEIYDRKLHLQRGYPSLFEMATKYFGYCAGAAQRRINSMRLLKDLPEVEIKIESGELSLTTASTLQIFFTNEAKDKNAYTKTEKLKVVEWCLTKSKREVERALVTLSPEREKRESLTHTSEDRLRLSISISEELHQKLNRLKDLWSHTNPSLSTEKLLERMVEIALDKVDPIRINSRISKRRTLKPLIQ